MLYKNLTFPKIPSRPFFYSNFVSTIDGKVQVTTPNQSEYWPIGSKLDYQTLLELRSHADVLIHGRTTATGFGTLNSLSKEEFKKMRKKAGKKKPIVYLILTRNPDSVISYLKNPNLPVIIITTENARITSKSYPGIEIERIGKNNIDIKKLSSFLHKKGFTDILVEGGPKTLGAFFTDNLIDEVFLTIAPKIFGNSDNSTLTMVEGTLFAPKDIKKLKLISLQQVEDEVYLRYRLKNF